MCESEISDFEYNDDEATDDEDFTELSLLILFPRRGRVIRERRNYFVELLDDDFFKRFRLSKITAQFIVDKLRNEISSLTTR